MCGSRRVYEWPFDHEKMRIPAWRYCDRTLTLLLKTFIDIILLRKGPEHVPDSWVVLVFSGSLLLLSTLVSAALVQSAETDSNLIGYVLFWLVLAVTGFARRVVPTMASIMACGSILTILMVAAAIIIAPALGGSMAAIVFWMILFWSVRVKGHIIARAIERHWYTGTAIAVTIFIMQYVSYLALTGRTGT
jgi:hypothetical protein